MSDLSVINEGSAECGSINVAENEKQAQCSMLLNVGECSAQKKNYLLVIDHLARVVVRIYQNLMK